MFHHYFNFFHFFFNITCIYWLGFWVITILPVCCKVDSAHTNMCAESCTHVCITQQEIFFFHLSPVIFHPHTLNLSIIVRNEKRAQEQPGMTLELHMKILWSWQTACAVLKNLGQGCLLSGVALLVLYPLMLRLSQMNLPQLGKGKIGLSYVTAVGLRSQQTWINERPQRDWHRNQIETNRNTEVKRREKGRITHGAEGK